MNIPSDEYAPFYDTYIQKVPKDGDIPLLLEKTFEDIKLFLESLENNKLSFAYAEGKWTIAQLLQHCIDVERLMAARALRIGRADKTPLPSFDENHYAVKAVEKYSTINEYLFEWELVRKSNVLMFKNFDSSALEERCIMSNNETSTRAVGGIIIGHALHHIQILKERYI